MERVVRGGLVLLVLSSAAAVTGYACIPQPDPSGLPARDAGLADATVPPLPTFDARHDAFTLPDAADAAAAPEASAQLGAIGGVVLNYSEGGGRGVVAGARVSVAGLPDVITDVRGVFELSSVPAGKVVINVSRPTDKSRRIAYSTTQVIVRDLAGGKRVSVFPVLHTGCVASFNFSIDATSGMTRQLSDACSSRSGAYASFHVDDATSFQRADGTLYGGAARVELIPLAFPFVSDTSRDLSWSIGMPARSASKGSSPRACRSRAAISRARGAPSRSSPRRRASAPRRTLAPRPRNACSSGRST
jgi:hypothetical protein